jgi:Type II secretion system (T2SS), protein F
LPDLTPVVFAALLGILWIVGLWYLGAYTPPAVHAWNRLARLRGLSVERNWGQLLGGRLPLLRRLQAETDIGTMLFIAGRRETTTAWFLRTGFIAGFGCAALLLLDEVGRITQGSLSYPPGVALLFGVIWAIYQYIRLRGQAQARQRVLNRAISDSLVHLAAMTFHQRLPASEALLIFSRCQTDGELQRVLNRPEARLGGQPGGAPPAEGTAAIYARLGTMYNVPMFHSLAAAMRRVTERGLSSRDVFTQLAGTTYGDQLAEARVQAAQTKTLIVVPMALMVFPLLLLIGAPLAASISSLFGR